MKAFAFEKKSKDIFSTAVLWLAEDGTWVIDGAVSYLKEGMMVRIPQETFDSEEGARERLASNGYEYKDDISE